MVGGTVAAPCPGKLVKTTTVAILGLRHPRGHRAVQQVAMLLRPVLIGPKLRTCRLLARDTKRQDSTTTFSRGDRLEDLGAHQVNPKIAVLMVVRRAVRGQCRNIQRMERSFFSKVINTLLKSVKDTMSIPEANNCQEVRLTTGVCILPFVRLHMEWNSAVTAEACNQVQKSSRWTARMRQLGYWRFQKTEFL